MMTLEQANEALTEARRGLARWEAWHAKKFGASFPSGDEQPPDWASWLSAARSWGVVEADRLFPEIPAAERKLALWSMGDHKR